MLLFNVDFENAFDTVSWKYLDFMLHNLGFRVTWKSWIKDCLESSRTSALINGSPTSKFNVRRDLRQGEPLSPFLFIIIMEGLYVAISDSIHSCLVRGINIGSSNITLSHLFFADDVVITTEWSSHDIDNIIRVLQVFYLASGLKINIHKSNIYGIGVSLEDVHLMASNTSCVAASFPFTYLGLPIGCNMSLIANWKPLVDKFKAKLTVWKANLLSFGGWLTLIKSILGSLSIYYLSIFRVPEMRWRMFSNPDALWVRVIKAFHGLEGGFDHNGCNHNGLWAKIVGSSNYLHSSNILPMDFIRFQVGCGSLIRFWKDIWLGSSTLSSKYNRLFRIEQDKDCLIMDRIFYGHWAWNWSNNLGIRNSSHLNELLLEISQVNVQVDNDKRTWSLDDDGTFTVCALRRLIDDHLLPSLDTTTTWVKYLSRKVNIFMWRLKLD
uniref:Putative RNA-directed DNA polymerase, eukaryota, reverse transcriptase zinc-binding domain protein n=1 Tax=Tanacetum cinerariifolium TaxID=118510 RepID=A0A699HWS3_TANCI|nr:putative RNA-directed DNA polymerase, eukaryota, reverse transcriptase zinc-binding domain protein [Tanacetum cinerariifolium]